MIEEEEPKTAEVEEFKRYGTIVETVQEAFSFIMEYMDRVGPWPAIEINPCFDMDDDEFQDHFHVAVFGVTNPKPSRAAHGD